MTNSVKINENASEALKSCIHEFNQSLCRDKQIEMVHKVYDLGYDEMAEALGASVFSQTVNLKFLLGEYEVTDEVNVVSSLSYSLRRFVFARDINVLLKNLRLIFKNVKL